MLAPIYNPAKWYWLVLETAAIFSSEKGGYVAADDPAYLAWRKRGYLPTTIRKEAELMEVLALAKVILPIEKQS